MDRANALDCQCPWPTWEPRRNSKQWSAASSTFLNYVMDELRIVDFVGLDPDDNVLIEANALDALRAIEASTRLSRELLGNVKLAYLDPPFNTGRTYPQYGDRSDAFTWNTSLKQTLSQVRRFLSDDGSVWLHLDDSEQHRARLVLDEVFGGEHFVATVIWERTRMPRLGGKAFAIRHDYLHIYRKSAAFQLARPAEHPVEAIWHCADSGSNEDATTEGSRLFDTRFATPKPEQLLRRIIELATQPGDVVMDCYAGSGTTPAVAHKLSRRWLAIEIESDTVRNFALPRLQQVVDGTDQGGISGDVGWAGGGGFTYMAIAGDGLRSRDASPQA
jgi:adenine specific DNA methylase Mod